MPENSSDQHHAEQDIRQYLKNDKAIAELQQANEKIAKKIREAYKLDDPYFNTYKRAGVKLGLDIAESEQIELIFDNQGEKIAFLDKLPPQFKTTGFNSRQIAQQTKANPVLLALINKYKVFVKKTKILVLLPR